MKLQKKLKTIRGFSTGLNLSVHAKKDPKNFPRNPFKWVSGTAGKARTNAVGRKAGYARTARQSGKERLAGLTGLAGTERLARAARLCQEWRECHEKKGGIKMNRETTVLGTVGLTGTGSSEIISNSKFGKETGTRRNRGFLVEDSETSTTTNNKNIKNTTARGWHKQRTSGNSGYSRLRVGLAKTAERDLLQYVTSLEFYVKGLKEKKIRRANFVVSNSIPPLHDPLLK
jgi:hypothetical protein